MKKFWEFKNATNGVGELYIYGEISSYKWRDTQTTADSFKADLKELGDIQTLNIYINSPGGSVFQGQAIYSILRRQKATVNVHIDGLAASIASVIAMAGDTIFMPKNAMMMVHNPWTYTAGNAQDLRKEADVLDKIRETLIEAYLSKGGDSLTKDKISDFLDEETWLTADECYSYGLCDRVVEAREIAASIDTELFSQYKNAPKEFLEAFKGKNKDERHELNQAERQQVIAESEASMEKINSILGGL